MPTLTIIIASVREGRGGRTIARWFIERARQHGKFDVQVADLRELNLPLMNEPHHPRLKKYVQRVDETVERDRRAPPTPSSSSHPNTTTARRRRS